MSYLFGQFLCEAREVYVVKKNLEMRQFPVRSAEVVFFATKMVSLDSKTMVHFVNTLTKLENHPDVVRVYTNISDPSDN